MRTIDKLQSALIGKRITDVQYTGDKLYLTIEDKEELIITSTPDVEKDAVLAFQKRTTVTESL